MSLNKNRLASTAATIGAISYPVWTRSIWDLRVNFGYCLKHPTDCNQDFMDVLLGAAVPAALVYFGPRLLAAWLRWVREEDVAKKIPEPPRGAPASYWLILKYFLSAAALFYLAYLLRA